MQRPRRRDRQIKTAQELADILEQQKICHLAMCYDNCPYVVPMLYVYHENALYFHCAEVGMKLDILQKNNKVCFEVQNSNVTDVVENSGKPCDWGFFYESVIGFGKAEIIKERNKKIEVYDLFVKKVHPPHYQHNAELYTEKRLTGSYIIKVTIESMTGKRWNGKKPMQTQVSR